MVSKYINRQLARPWRDLLIDTIAVGALFVCIVWGFVL